MPVKKMPPLVASGGSLAIVHRIASYVWGAWKVTWPKDYDAPDLGEGRTQGYLAKLSTVEPGRFGRRWVKKDVSIDAVAGTSTVERTLDDTAEDVSGEVVISRLIGPDGYGHLVPGKHFAKGDLVPVKVWGKTLVLPVMSIKRVASPEEGWRTEVMVGGSLVVNQRGGAQHNAELERQIREEAQSLSEALAEERQARNEAISRSETRTKTEVTTIINDAATGIRADYKRDVTDAERRLRDAYSKAIESAIGLEAQERQAALEELAARISKTANDLSTQGDNVADEVARIEKLAGEFGVWSEANQVKINGAFALFASAQRQYNDINSIMWIDQANWNLQKNKTDKAQNDAIKALAIAEILGRAREPHVADTTMYISADGTRVSVKDDSGIEAFKALAVVSSKNAVYVQVRDEMPATAFGGRVEIRNTDSLSDGIVGELIENGVFSAFQSGTKGVIPNNIHKSSRASGNVFNFRIPDWFDWPTSGWVKIRLIGTWFPGGIAPSYQAEIDAI